MSKGWSEVEDLIEVLRKRWDRGQFASAYAEGAGWEPVSLPVRAPSGAELLDHFDEVRRWAAQFEANSRDGDGRARFRVEYRTVGGRNIGANQLPARIWVDTLAQLCSLLGTTAELSALDEVLAMTREALPEGLPWVAEHPMRAVEHRHIWERTLATVRWIAAHETRSLYVRQLDVEGVDTKFVELHRKLLDQLLCAALAPERIDPLAPVGDFTRRFGFRAKPGYVRIRLLGAKWALPLGISEVRLRAGELAAAGLEAKTVFIIENEITYLAFPDVADAVVMWRSGYGLEAQNAGTWFGDKQLVYWGDIDTHGLAILNSLRTRHSEVESILMDRDTLLAHSGQWVTEPAPTSRPLAHLTAAEAELYADLIEDRFGSAVRLEQERVRFALLRRALEPWVGPPGRY